MKSLSWNKNADGSCVVLSACEPREQSEACLSLLSPRSPLAPTYPDDQWDHRASLLRRRINPPLCLGRPDPRFRLACQGVGRLVSELQGNLAVKPRFEGGGREVPREPRDGAMSW